GAVSTSRVAPPAVPVAVIVSVLPPSPLAATLFPYTTLFRSKVHDVAAAIPSVPVVTGVVGVTVPLPGLAAKVTATPETGLPLASPAVPASGRETPAPAVSDLPPPFGAIEAAAPALSAMGPEL